MEQFMPLEMLKNNFKAKIDKLQLISKDGHVSIYEAITSFGRMTLVVEEFVGVPQDFPAQNEKGNSIAEGLSLRNKLILSQQIITPLIYEQQIIKMRQDYTICMSLCESIALCDQQDILSLRAECLFENLVKCAYQASKSELNYELDCYRITEMMKSTHNSRFFLDFTKISIFPPVKDPQIFTIFKQSLCQIMRKCQSQKMQEVLFICQYPFVFNLQKISACETWFDLAMLFNLLQSEKITVVTQTRSKIFPINKLSGAMKLEYEGNQYENYHFRDGFRMDGISEITFDDLKSRFFEDKMIYYMTKNKYMCVRKEPIEKEEQWIVNKIEYEDLIYVKPEISKVEFINFLIAYIKYIEPILHEINFFAEENILQLVFTNKLKKIRKIAIKFHSKYVVKDEELSMIIEKSKIKKASIFLQKMSFGDSFLIFLANCDKMVNVKSFNVSYCSKITDSGLNLLLASPFCKNLSILKICSLPLPDFEIIKSKLQLKQLTINDCIPYDQGEVYLCQLSIQRLQAIGLNINLKIPEGIKYLYLNQDVFLEQLKFLIKLPLIELKIKLIESKKNISSFFGAINSFYSKDNPLKLFCEGSCRKTLKYLDISHSTIKLKDIKPLLHLENLETLICESMERDKFIDVVLPHHIISLSLKGSRINAEVVQEMTQKINFFIKLNILNTDINEHTLEQSIKNKKYINLLEISEEQIDLKFFSKKSCIEGLEIHLHKLIRDDNQPILNFILYKQVNICKELNFICESKFEARLVRKINRFLSLYQENIRSFASELTLNVNSIPILKLINLKCKENMNDSFTMVSKKSANHKTKINIHTFLAQQYRLPLVDEYINIDLFNVTLHKVIQLYPDSLLEICIRSNRILCKGVISLISKYAGGKLACLDFRNCLFTYAEVQQDLYQFPYLESVNEGEYEISIAEEDQCEQQLQKILKFFMKLSQKDKMKLHLTAHAISQKQLYFSIIYEILHHHSQNIVLISINFENLPVDHQSEAFWKKIFLLEKLQTFHLRYMNDFECPSQEEVIIAVQFQKLANLNLFSLDIETSIQLIIPQQLSFSDIRRLSLSYSEMEISDHVVFKLLKSTPTLNHLTLKLQNCCNITSVSRISESLERMANLVHLSLNLENTPVKESSLLELIQNLHKNTLLQKFQLNINNCSIGLTELVKTCQNLINHVKFCHILIFALQIKKPPFFRDQAQLLAQGIQLIFTV